MNQEVWQREGFPQPSSEKYSVGTTGTSEGKVTYLGNRIYAISVETRFILSVCRGYSFSISPITHGFSCHSPVNQASESSFGRKVDACVVDLQTTWTTGSAPSIQISATKGSIGCTPWYLAGVLW